MFTSIFGFAIGYAASVFTWPKLRTWLGGLDAEITRLEERARALAERLHDQAGRF